MGFTIGKAAWTMFQPLAGSFVLLVLGLLLARFRLKRVGAVLVATALVVQFVTMFTTAGSVALARLEDHVAKPNEPSNLNCIVVLGGAIDTAVTAARGGYEMAQASDRFIETLRLARAHPDAKIIISGGDGSFSGSYAGDGEVARRFFTDFGIAPDRLLSETDSRTTSENVAFSAPMLKEAGLERCLLVTSAYHMPRALGLYERQGIDLVPWPTDYRTTGATALDFDFTQPALNTQIATTAAREWAALVMAYLGGETLRLIPEASKL